MTMTPAECSREFNPASRGFAPGTLHPRERGSVSPPAPLRRVSPAATLAYFSLPLFALLFVALAGPTEACSPPQGYRPPTIRQKVERARVVLYGRVRRTYPDPQFDNSGVSGGSVYTAEMEVYCSLKGQSVSRMFNVTQAGILPGHCSSTDLNAGQEYFVLLDGNYRPHGLDMSEIEVSKMDEVVTACGLNPVYPLGVDPETVTTPRCPVLAPSSECGDFQPAADLPDDGSRTRSEELGGIDADASRQNTGSPSTNQREVNILMTSFAAILLGAIL